MNKSLTRCQAVAFGAGVLLCAACVGIVVLLSWLEKPPSILGRSALITLGTLILPTAATCAVAIYSWPNWKAALITALVPTAFAFLLMYTSDIRTLVETSSRHAMNHTLGYVSPLNIFGQAGRALPLLLWAALISALGLFLRRAIAGEKPLDGHQTESFFTPFLLGVIALVILGVITYTVIVTLRNSPGGRSAAARKTLLSPISTESERSRAVLDIWRLRTDETTELLRLAAKHQPPPINIMAAGFLAERNDISALPLLETQLMISGTLKGKHFEWKIGTSLRGIKDPRAVPALIRLMKSGDPETRQGAIQALRKIGGDAVIDPLVAGLYDTDWEVRWISAMGLAETIDHGPTKRDWHPDRNEFRNDEKRYLDHWKAWAATRADH